MATIFILISTGKMVNPTAPAEIDGIRHPSLIGSPLVQEIEEDPAPEGYDPDMHCRTENWEATERPYITYTCCTAEELYEKRLQRARDMRRMAYEQEADPIQMKVQRGEATYEEWTSKVAEIKARFPKPEEPNC